MEHGPNWRSVQAFAPTRRGARPLLRAALSALVFSGVGACANNDANQVTAPVVLGMTQDLAPAYDDGETQMYEVRIPVALPIRKPTDTDLQGLPKADPYPRGPYLKESDLRLEVRYTLSNLDDQPHDVQLLLDPWNEFVRYKPGILVQEENTQPNYSGYMRQFRIDGKSRLTGSLTNDDMTELAVDLDTVENILKNPPTDPNANVSGIVNRVFNLQNRSNDGDPIVTPFIPQVIAGLTGFDLGLRSFDKETMAVEITIDITDLNGNRVIPQGQAGDKIGMPSKVITPPGATLLN